METAELVLDLLTVYTCYLCSPVPFPTTFGLIFPAFFVQCKIQLTSCNLFPSQQQRPLLLCAGSKVCLGQWEEKMLWVDGKGSGPGTPHPHPSSIPGGATAISPHVYHCHAPAVLTHCFR